MNESNKFRVWAEKENKMYYYDTKNNDFVLNCVGQVVKISYAGHRCREPLFVFEKLDESYKKLQCTGLEDKNGKLIYQGDIIEFKEFKQTNLERRSGIWSQKTQIVNYDPISRIIIKCEKWLEFYCDPIGEDYIEDLWRDFYRISRGEIIGNIYENERLLKKLEEENAN